MGGSWFLRFLLVAALLVSSSSHGLHRKLMVSSIEDGDFSSTTANLEESAGMSRENMEVMDYSDPGANTNPKTGYIFSPPPRG